MAGNGIDEVRDNKTGWNENTAYKAIGVCVLEIGIKDREIDETIQLVESDK